MGLKNYSWPIYKGPVKRAGFAKRLYEDPFSIKRHAKTSEPKHAGNDHAYQLYIYHHPYVPKHAKPDYRYASDGRVRKVIPKQEVTQVAHPTFKERKIPKGPQEPPPPRAMLIHLYNDRYEDHFSLDEYRESRMVQTWWKRFCECNYFRELLLMDLVVITVSILLISVTTSGFSKTLANTLLFISIVLCPILMMSALYHHVHKIRK